MSKIVWDATGSRFYETGISRCVLYPIKDKPKDSKNLYENGVAWNGITSVSESSSGGEPSPQYADNIKYLNIINAEQASLNIEAYDKPEEFSKCDGTRSVIPGLNIGQQPRKQFGLCYRTIKGNDIFGNDYGYKLHIVYGCIASPTDRSYATVNDSPEAITFSWSVSTNAYPAKYYKPTSILTIDSTSSTTNQTALHILEKILYGSEHKDPRLPLPDEIIDLFAEDFFELDIYSIPEISVYKHVPIQTIQTSIQILDNTVTGELIPQSGWIWDTFSFEHGVIKNKTHYYIGLDFSDNVFSEHLISVLVYNNSDPDNTVDVLHSDRQKAIIEVNSIEDQILIKQTDTFGRTFTQVLDLSQIILLDAE